MASVSLGNTSVVLVEPQDDINIGTVVRASRNFGLSSVRLVRPASADPERIGISAPRSEEFIEKMERFDDLNEAIGDCTLTLGLTARRRTANWRVLEPRQAAREVVEASKKGRVALLFGREDSGLPNEALDRCHALVTIPTNPDYSSMNLGQAVNLMLWEVFRAASEIDTSEQGLDEVSIESEFDAAPMAGVERMFEQAEAALEAVEFFKSDGAEHIMRSLRSVFLRAHLDQRELAIWHGIFKEIVAYLDRHQVDKGEDDQSATKQ